MREAIVRWLAPFVLFTACAAWGDPALTPAIREIAATSMSGSRTIFLCLYVGTASMRKLDAEEMVEPPLRLLHPVAEVARHVDVQAPGRWYMLRSPGPGLPSGDMEPLLSDHGWKRVPPLARHALAALGMDDPELILVSCNASGSLSIYYLPRYDHDRAFYQRKLALLERYLASHDPAADLPLNVMPGGNLSGRSLRPFPRRRVVRLKSLDTC